MKKKVRLRAPAIIWHPELGAPVAPRLTEYFDEDDPLVLHHPGLFATDDEIAAEADTLDGMPIEQATANPGERRVTRRR